jgi:peptidoglycan/xylan/chitin deacetylase (PgdA/CDA1 family)
MRLSVRLLLSALLLSTAARAQSPSGVPILAYHRFDPSTAAYTTVKVSTFEGQLDILAKDGYTIVPLHQALDVLQKRTPMPAKPIAAITVDDGHESVYKYLFPIVKERHIPVTLFIYPSAISNASYALTWDQLREMKASGLVDIQCHTYWHPDFRKEKKKQTPDAYAKFVDMQLNKSRAKLDQELGTHIDLLAWPYGIYDPELEAAAQHAGYRAALAYDGLVAHPGDDSFAIHRIPTPDFMRGSAFESLLHGTAKQKTARE